MPKIQTISEFLNSYCQSNKVNAKSLISSLYGDLILPNGGQAWVETISLLLAPLGINNRLVRTSLFRLSEEDWLTSTRLGRKSYYELTDKAKSQTELAEKVIYHADQKEWDGEWTLVFIVMQPVEAQARRQLEQELAWIGFGAVTKHILAHPTVKPELVADRVRSLSLQSSVVCMRAKNLHQAKIGFEVSDRHMAEQCFQMHDLTTQYQTFISIFAAINEGLVSKSTGDNIELIALRILLVDCYRRIVLLDPRLPSQLVPDQWIGEKAYQVFKQSYQLLYPRTEDIYRDMASLTSDKLSSVKNKRLIA